MDEDGGYESKHDEKIIYRVGSNFVVVLAVWVFLLKKAGYIFYVLEACFGRTVFLRKL